MSNQVYSNDQRKYYALAGFNNYTLGSDQSPINGGSDAYVAYNDASLEQGAGLVSVSEGDVSFLQEGMYGISANVAFLAKDNSTDPSFTIQIIVNRAYNPSFSQTLAYTSLRLPNVGSGGTNYEFIQALNFVGFFGVGDFVRVKLANTDPTSGNTLTIKSNSSGLVLTKIY